MSNKIKVLTWSDAVFSTTGFGTVSKYILKALHESGLYDIDQLGINFFDPFYDKKVYPYNITPARLDDPNDPYGNQMFLQALGTGKYDLVFIINDTFVVHGIADRVEKHFKLVDDDLRYVKNNIEYLVDAAKRAPKRDFVNLTISVIISITVNLAMTPENAKTLWQFLRDALQHFLYLK